MWVSYDSKHDKNKIPPLLFLTELGGDTVV